MQLIGRPWGEATILRLAAAVELYFPENCKEDSYLRCFAFLVCFQELCAKSKKRSLRRFMMFWRPDRKPRTYLISVNSFQDPSCGSIHIWETQPVILSCKAPIHFPSLKIPRMLSQYPLIWERVALERLLDSYCLKYKQDNRKSNPSICSVMTILTC